MIVQCDVFKHLYYLISPPTFDFICVLYFSFIYLKSGMQNKKLRERNVIERTSYQLVSYKSPPMISSDTCIFITFIYAKKLF